MSHRTARSKSPEALHQEQLENRKKLWSKIWTYVFIAIVVGIILGSIYLQILHHP